MAGKLPYKPVLCKCAFLNSLMLIKRLCNFELMFMCLNFYSRSTCKAEDSLSGNGFTRPVSSSRHVFAGSGMPSKLPLAVVLCKSTTPTQFDIGFPGQARSS